MLARYGIKSVEYLFYAFAALAALPLFLKSDWAMLGTPTDVSGIVFILIGIGVLLPRAIAYSRWKRVGANVSPYRGTWDGERSASYTYEIDSQSYTGSFRSMYGSRKYESLAICVNPNAPWIRYPVFWNVWVFGAAMLGVGLFFLISDQSFIG
jgi:hypothetical protein